MSLDELEAAVMIIVVENHEQGLQLSAETITDHLIDPGQVLVSEHGRKGCNGLNEVVGSRAGTS